MRIGIISDTHRQIGKKIIKKLESESFDLIIHLGDYIKDAQVLGDKLGIEIIKVKGNCDIREITEKDEILLTIKNKKFLITHGHKYNVKYTLDNLYYRALELDIDIVLFGHTHKFFNRKIDNILFFNPGSPTNPNNISEKTYGIIDIDNDINAQIVNL